MTFQVNHVPWRKLGGSDKPSNLALACERCNASKGTDLTGVDPGTGQVVRLFDPRTESWNEHFEAARAVIIGRTPAGRTTVAVLGMNQDRRRKQWG